MGVTGKVLILALLLLISSTCSHRPEGEETVGGHWGEWGNINSCSVTCGLGTTSMERKWVPGPDDKPDEGPYTSIQSFPCTHETHPDCPRDGSWSGWTSWSHCTKACGGGVQERQRECRGPLYGGKPCEGTSEETTECNTLSCPAVPRNFNMSQCREGYNFTCTSKKMCVPQAQKCDMAVNCNDGSDEDDCPDIHFIRGGHVRYDLSMWRNGAVVTRLTRLTYLVQAVIASWGVTRV